MPKSRPKRLTLDGILVARSNFWTTPVEFSLSTGLSQLAGLSRVRIQEVKTEDGISVGDTKGAVDALGI